MGYLSPRRTGNITGLKFFSLLPFVILVAFFLTSTTQQAFSQSAPAGTAGQAADKKAPSKGDKIKEEWEKAKKKCKEEAEKKAKEAKKKPAGEPGGPAQPDPYKDCLKKALQDLLKKHNKKWKLKDTCDLENPKFEELLDSIVNKLAQFTDLGMKTLLEDDITYDIKNYKHYGPDGVNRHAEHQTNSDGTSTITFYNPNSTTVGWLAPWESSGENLSCAQPADESAQFDPDFFIDLTVTHELAHVMMKLADRNYPGVALQWMLTWSQSLYSSGNPDQRYYNPQIGGNDLAYEIDASEGFGVAVSYYYNDLPALNPVVAQYIKDFTDYLK